MSFVIGHGVGTFAMNTTVQEHGLIATMATSDDGMDSIDKCYIHSKGAITK